ncbi:sensor histidine kinase [Aquabacterium sp.]|uniref:sensor histidine kinase n=1 Tax=Aquabacterium sp. TaxID=1872578 RepID=UPI003D6D2575
MLRSLSDAVRRTGSQTRVGVAFFVLALVLFSITGGLSGLSARREAERASGAMLAQLATAVAARLDADVAERFREIRRLTEIETTLALDMTPDRWRRTLERLQSSTKHYSWIGVTDLDGTVLASTGGLLQGVSVQQRPWFKAGLAKPSVLDVHDAKLLSSLLPASPTGEPHRFIDVAAPLLHEGRQRMGVLGAHLNWDWAEQRRRATLATLDARQALDIVIVNRQGQADLGPKEPALRGVSAAELSLAPVVRTWSDGRQYLTAAGPSQAADDYPGMGWTVVVRQPVDVAFQAANSLQRRIWIFGGFGALMFGVLGWWLAGVLNEPLRRVAVRARVLTPSPSGVPMVGANEVDQVADSISKLIEELRSREHELREFNERLEDIIRQRTSELEQSNKDLQSFTNSVSHDLRSPLGQMAVLLRFMLQHEGADLPAGVSRKIEMVAAECDRLRHLCEEFLDLAFAQQRKLELSTVDMEQLVQSLVAEIQSSGEGHAAQVVVGPLPPVKADPVLVRQVWANLLSNAFKYSSKVAEPRIVVSAVTEGANVVYTVKDNGAGFDAQEASRLFGAFQRLHDQRDFKGVGIGLSIVKRVVQRHKGRVWAESTPGQGAQFHFSLPTSSRDQGIGM